MLYIMTMDELETGLVLKNIGNFDMSKFEGRLILQKTVYVLKSFGVDLGYGYGWFLHGTYSPKLAQMGLKLENKMDNIPDIKVKFTDDVIQKKYNDFVDFVRDKKDDVCLLEICASICYLNKMKFTKAEILNVVENKKPKFTRERCIKMWDELEKYGVINI